MSFKCDNCTIPQPTHAKPNRVVVHTRPKAYNLKDGRQTLGTEIVHEADLCDQCGKQFNG